MNSWPEATCASILAYISNAQTAISEAHHSRQMIRRGCFAGGTHNTPTIAWTNQLAKMRELAHGAKERRETAVFFGLLFGRGADMLSEKATVLLVGGPVDGWQREISIETTRYGVRFTDAAGVQQVAIYEIATEMENGAEFEFVGIEPVERPNR